MARSGAAARSPPPILPLRRHPSPARPPRQIDTIHCGASPGQLTGSQSSKAPRGASPAQVSGQEDGHAKSHADSSPKGEGESPPVNGTEEAEGAPGDAIEPAPPSQGAEAKREVPPKETPKKKKFAFKKPFKLSGLAFKRNRREGAGDPSA
ncbi:hypothetical protein J1605_006604 [Eschrichtius robustus]|uniref:MARCKS-related protein n=1 Tax=Eschrichtius robustus TaxID=9764 RepID=A0AB34H2V2_ESCRO|nr:hypothetical protein J1605_006604 [Eschrichtius robustus]